MISNIAIVCNEYDYAKQVAEELASRLEMNWFDAFEMLLFDDKPRTLDQTLEMIGARAVRRHEESIIKYASHFENAIIVCESGAVESKKNWKTLKETALVVYLHHSPTSVVQWSKKQKWETARQKRFFGLSIARAKKRIELCKKNATLCINCNRKAAFVAASMTIRALATIEL